MEEMNIHLQDQVDNIRYLDIVFNSTRNEIVLAEKRRLLAGGEEMIIGKYFVDDESIHFSHPRERFNPKDLIASIIHELIHYIQDVTDKFPELRDQKKRAQLGNDAPWEKEAYSLMYDLVDDFLEDCDFYWNDGFDMNLDQYKTA